MNWILALIFVAFFAGETRASEVRPLYRSARAQAMGGAYVGLADDEAAVFLNPAGLAGFQKYEVHLVNADIEFSGDFASSVSDLSGASSATGVSAGEPLIGKSFVTRAQYAPVLVMPNFGMGVLMDVQSGLIAENRALPRVTIGLQNTNGFQIAYGQSVLRSRKSKTKRRPDFRVGIGLKLLWRRGGYFTKPLTELTNLQSSVRRPGDIVGDFKSGVGVDLGTQYIQPIHSTLTYQVGAAFTEVGDINFGSPTDPQAGNFSLGMALIYDPGLIKFIAAYDYANILETTDWRKKNHFGLQFGLPIFDIYAGVNQASFTYGGSVDLWMIKVTALSYAEELGEFVRQNQNRRYMLKFNFKFNI